MDGVAFYLRGPGGERYEVGFSGEPGDAATIAVRSGNAGASCRMEDSDEKRFADFFIARRDKKKKRLRSDGSAVFHIEIAPMKHNGPGACCVTVTRKKGGLDRLVFYSDSIACPRWGAVVADILREGARESWEEDYSRAVESGEIV